ncbi:methyltransferase family protein [Pengzhenrongella phosphoraccumulans]|uniref:methyltransferase family protein n=1 Tax=Pengzhenrongella phosphoraccumulans TaxID=3114394 RepID=UPI00388CF837
MTALVLYVLGCVLAFGLRSWAQWRSTGSTGYRGLSGPPRSLTWWGGILFPVGVVLGIAAPILTLANVMAPPSAFAHPAFGIAGAVLAIAGLVVVLVAQSTMGTSWRIGVDPGERTPLVTTGIFGKVRNPTFAGMVLMAAGVMAMVPTPVALLGLACLAAAIEIQVRAVEEPYLERVHGSDYADYTRRAGRFIPR